MFHDSDSARVPEGTADSTNSVASQRPMSKCGICGNSFALNESTFRPFCSQRCQQIDLGRWMNESYGLPWEDSSVPESDVGLVDDESE
jgi:endogenous inhibitor of DNA gyrase (YacG/DUF329 family)